MGRDNGHAQLELLRSDGLPHFHDDREELGGPARLHRLQKRMVALHPARSDSLPVSDVVRHDEENSSRRPAEDLRPVVPKAGESGVEHVNLHRSLKV